MMDFEEILPLTKMKNCTGNEGGKKRDVRKAKNALRKLRGLTFRFNCCTRYTKKDCGMGIRGF
jgi:hypothetical protein